MNEIAPLILVCILLIATALGVPLLPVRRRKGSLGGFPVVTIGLIAVNVLVFAATSSVAGDGGSHGVLTGAIGEHWGLVPARPNLVALFTHMFLHVTWRHLLGNMLGLYLFGPDVEDALGRVEFLIFYLAAGVAAGMMHLVIVSTLMPSSAYVPLVGASGAIFGVFGLFAVRFWRTRLNVFFVSVPAIWVMCAFALFQFILGIVSVSNQNSDDPVAYWAHVGGFIFGLAISMPLRMREDSRREYAIEDAEKAAANGEHARAAAHYRAVLDLTPADPAAHHSLGRACVALQQGEAAHRHLREAIQLYLRAGDAPAVTRVYAEAAAAFKSFPLPPSTLQRVASAAEETYQYAVAQHALAELCRDHPEAREAEMGLLRLGKLHLQKLGQPENAVGIFSEFLRLYPESEWAGHATRLRDEAESASA